MQGRFLGRFRTRLPIVRSALLLVLGLTSSTAGADPADNVEKSYILLHGESAKKFLIGNTRGDQASARYVGYDYFINPERVLADLGKDYGGCSIHSYKLMDGRDCLYSDVSIVGGRCIPYRVWAAPPLAATHAKGDLIGYFDFIYGDPKNPEKIRRVSVFKGNITSCPILGKASPRIPIALPFSEKNVPPARASAEPDDDLSPSSNPVLTHYLIGNSIVWRRRDGAACDSAAYFREDGGILWSRCPEDTGGNSDRQIGPIEVGSSHWRIVGDRFCLEDPGGSGAFPDVSCDPFALQSIPKSKLRGSASGRSVQVDVLRAPSDIPVTDEPGQIFMGNPMGFKDEAN
jgi:hypothetical protein